MHERLVGGLGTRYVYILVVAASLLLQLQYYYCVIATVRPVMTFWLKPNPGGVKKFFTHPSHPGLWQAGDYWVEVWAPVARPAPGY